MAITFTQLLDLKLNRITNMGAPAASSDAVTKQYVDNLSTGLIWKDAVRVGSDADLDLAAPGVIDGITLASGNRVLVMGQTDPVENGIYRFDGTMLVRADDADAGTELRGGAAVTVSEGTDLGNHTYVLTSDGPITVGTTAQNWSLLNAGTSAVYTEGDGIDVTNNAISAVPALNAGVSVGPSGIGVVTDPDGGLQVGVNGVATKLVANAALKADATGLAFVARPSGGLDTDAAGAGVVLKPDVGLAVDATGVQTVLAPDMGLAVDSSGLQVVAGNGVAVDALGVNVVPQPDKGLLVDATGVGVVLRPNDGLDVDASGVGVNTATAGGLATGVAGLGVVPAPNMGVAVDATGVAVVLDAAGGLAVDALGVKIVPDPTVINDAAKTPLVASATGLAINAAWLTRRFAASVGDGVATSIAVAHNLNTRDVQVELYATTAPYGSVYADVLHTDVNTVTLEFGTAPTSGEYRCVVVG